jgi:hypothetical protein
MKRILIIASICIISATSLFALPKTAVSDSTITNESAGENTAIGKSNINTGVQASGAQITESEISTKTKANINASSSTVNTGIKAEGTTIENSTLKTNTNAGTINAANSRVSTGIEISGATNSDLESNVSVGSISAQNSTVNVGSIKGQAEGKAVSTNVGVGEIKARNETKNIGNVNLNAGPGSGGKSKVFNRDEGDKNQPQTNIGTVNVDSSLVREVNVTVGSGGGISDKIKERNMSKTYSGNDGVDPGGTKHVYVSEKEKQKAEKQDSDAGNVDIKSNNRKVKKVDVFVE